MGRDKQLVARKIALSRDKIDVSCLTKESTIKVTDGFLVFPFAFKTLKIGNRPLVFPIVDNADLGRRIRSDDFIELRQILAKRRHLTEHTCIFASLVVNYRAMKFFGSAARFAPLEILNGVRAMRHRLQRGKPVHTRTLHLVDICPVDAARRAFHEHKRTA